MTQPLNPQAVKPSFLTFESSRHIAYHLSDGAEPGVVFMGGFKSDMTGAKAWRWKRIAKNAGRRFLRFDYTGHGQSSGSFKEGTIGDWKQDALDALDNLGAKQNLLVGSSMGAWISLLLALERPQKVAGMVGIASAPDFTERLIWDRLDVAQKKQLMVEGVFYAPSCYGEEPYPITRTLIEEGKGHLLLDGPIALDVPIRLIHGLNDEDVPWQVSVTLMERLRSADVALNLIKGGGHRMSEPSHLAILCDTVQGLLEA